MRRGRLRSRLAGVCVVATCFAGAACKRKAPPAPPLAAEAKAEAPPPAPAPKEVTLPPFGDHEARPECAPVDPVKVAPFTCEPHVVKTPVPAVVDPEHTLSSFLDRLSALARGTGKRRVRIAIYGDSNLTSDFFSGHLRRVLQERYGDAGHGYVSLSRPWGSYKHEDVVHGGFWPMFKLYAPTTHLVYDKQYGFANMAAQSKETGAAAWVATTADKKSKVGKSASHFEIHYLKQPRGGTFTVLLDKKELRSVSTAASSFEAGFETVETSDGQHELRCSVVGDGPVRFFGASLDREPSDLGGAPGVQVDSLGAGSLNYHRLNYVANETRRAQLTQRGYDLVILWLGTNVMFVPPNKDYAKEFIGELRAALPDVPVLVLSPADTIKQGEMKSDPRIVEVTKQMREVASESRAAFWDFRDAMGGDDSMLVFARRGLAGKDRVHFGPEGSQLMAQRLLCALSAELTAHLEKNPKAGCSADPKDRTSGDPKR
jgi:lysophospholipase L1-like esterase